MLLLRFAGILAAIAVAAGIVAYLLTGQSRYLQFAGRIAKYALFFALILFALLAAERLLA